MVVRRIVCLANSYKHGGRCVAGVELLNDRFGRWIRPVTDRPARAISGPEQTCTDGTASELLDILDIDFGTDFPEEHQSENVLIAPDRKWKKAGKLSLADLEPILHGGHEPLWPHTESTRIGCSDKISADNLPRIESSLALIRPTNALVRVFQSQYKEKGKLDVRVRFEWGGEQNDLKLTDLQKSAAYQAGGVGVYDLKNPIMCVSIGEIFRPQEAAYKLVAGLII